MAVRISAVSKEVQTLVVSAERGVVAGFQRHLVQTSGQTIPDDRRQRRRLSHPLVVALVGLVLVVVRRRQLVRRLEREAVAGLQRQCIQSGATVKYRAHVAITPGRTWRRREAALREEIQPLAVAREHRGTAFVAVAAQHGLATVGARDQQQLCTRAVAVRPRQDRKSTRLNSSHVKISYAVFCLKKKIKQKAFAHELVTLLCCFTYVYHRYRFPMYDN